MIFFPSVSAGLVNSIHPQKFLFDFGTSSFATTSRDTNGNYWNNFSGNPEITNIVSTKNIPTRIYIGATLDFAAGTNGGLCSTCTSSAPGPYYDPDPNLLGDFAIPSVTRDYYYRTSTESNLGFKFSFLDTSKRYNFSFFGTRNFTDYRATAYFVSGGNGTYSGSLMTTGPSIGANQGQGNYNGNNNTVVNITGIIPDANRQIAFYTNLVSGTFQYLSAMSMTIL